MALTLQGFLVLVALAAWPAPGLRTSDRSNSRGMTPEMPLLFPEGQLPGSSGEANRQEFSIEKQWPKKPTTKNVWPSLPVKSNYDWPCNITGIGENKRYFNVSAPRLDESFALYQPLTRAAIVVMPGAGPSYLRWEREGTEVAEWLNSLGISAFVLKYRVPIPVNSINSFMDAERAMSTVRSRAHELGIDSDRIGVIGFSTGGRLASWVSDNAIRSYARIDEIDDVPFKPDFQLLIYGNTPEEVGRTGQRPPPTFIAQAKDDPCVPYKQTEKYCQAIKDVEQSCTGFLYPNGGHGVGVCTGEWKPGLKHRSGNRGAVNGKDGWYNTWSGDSLCGWFHEAEKWLRDMEILL